MDLMITANLAQDGIMTGAIYALLALALVLVFSVTRVIFIPQGDFVAYGALTLAALQAGKAPTTGWVLLGLALCALTMDGYRRLTAPGMRPQMKKWLLHAAIMYVALPVALLLLSREIGAGDYPMVVKVVMALALVIPMGPYMYRLAFEPLARSSTLVLLIVAVAVHFAMNGLSLAMFGAEGSRTQPFTDAVFPIGDGILLVSGQAIWVIGTSLALMGALYFYFDRTLSGKSLRATSINRLGAQLVGINPAHAGLIAFTVAATLGALCGVLIGPITTIYYDSGFLIGLKGFVGAIIGVLASYPAAAAGSLLVGLLESYSSFWASAYKEVIVFTLIIPVLLWRSLARHGAIDDDEE